MFVKAPSVTMTHDFRENCDSKKKTNHLDILTFLVNALKIKKYRVVKSFARTGAGNNNNNNSVSSYLHRRVRGINRSRVI